MLKKITVIFITLVFIINNTVAFASDDDKEVKSETLTEMTNNANIEDFESLWESGTTGVNSKKPVKNIPITNQQSGNFGVLDKLICYILIVIPYLSNTIISQITSDGKEPFTMQKVITNYYDLFNIESLINPQNVDNNNKDNKKDKNTVMPLAKNVAVWFVGIRNLAAVASIIMLIYVGLRMAIATTYTKKANYKKMLMSWLESVLFLFILHIFVIVLIVVSNWLVGVLKDISKADESLITFEETILTNISENLVTAHNTYGARFYTVLYIVLSYYEFKFFMLYTGRIVRVAYYIIISPLVCLTIPIDKVGDGKAQSFEHWVLEIVIITFMQPIHLLVYLVTMASASEILLRNPVLAILFIALMSHAEKTFKSILKIKPTLGKDLKDVKLNSMVGGNQE